ncbi:MAG: hypothetical protein IT463_08250 [Planctomycetes bacterium]|nr:hypothetical protein [Planctomycetota bacterium]
MTSRTSIALALLLAIVAVVHGQSLSKKDVQALVKEYVAEGTEASRRGDIERTLSQADRTLLGPPLKDAAGASATVAQAIALGSILRVSGLFAAARKHATGDVEEAILEYGLMMAENDAAEHVWEQWKKLAPEAPSWVLADTLLRRHFVSLAMIRSIKTYVDDAKPEDPRRELAAEVLRFQLGLGAVSIEGINESWAGLVAEYENDAKAFKCTGDDFFALGLAAATAGAQRTGANWRLVGGMNVTANIPQAWANDGTVTYVVRVRPVEGNGVVVMFKTEEGEWKAEMADNEWRMSTVDGVKTAPATQGAWQEFRYAATTSEKAPAKDAKVKRLVRVTVDGKPLVPQGNLKGKLLYVQVSAPAGSVARCTVGGIERIVK